MTVNNPPTHPLFLSAQGILFCSGECLKVPRDLLRIFLHESNRVYRDKLVEEVDSQLFDKLQAEAVKKFYEVRVLCRVFGRGRGVGQGRDH